MASHRILICLAGADMPADMRQAWAVGADLLIAADGGADRLREAGLSPHVLIGDMDSVDPQTLLESATVVEDRDPIRTDCEKCLRFCEVSYPGSEILVICAEGDQFDHEIATLFAVTASSLRPSIAMRRGLCLTLAPGHPVSYNLDPRARVSLLPILPCEGVSISGVVWPLDRAEMSARGLISISNEATGPISAAIESGLAALFVHVPVGTWPSELTSPL